MPENDAETPIESDAETEEGLEQTGGAEIPAGRWAIVAASARRYRVSVALACVGVAIVTASAATIEGAEQPEVTLELGGPLAYYELPQFLADLTPTHGRRHHIQLAIVAQAPEQDLARVEELQLEISSAIQSHLRDHTTESLIGQAGAERLRADLIRIVNEVIAPAEIRNVLFTRILID